MSAYESKPDPMQAFNDRLSRIEEALRAGASSNGSESLVITGPDGITAYDPDTGARLQYSQGRLWFWDNFDENPENPGLIMVDPGAGTNMLRMFPPYSDGDGNDSSITVQGRRPGEAGHVWVYSDGRVDIISPLLGLYELPTTSSGANLHLGMVGGEWTVAWVTSSARYKQDIVDAPIDPTAPLRWRPRWWRDRNEVDAIGDEADFHHGFIAEEIAEESPACVRYDDEGRPDSLRQMHMLAEVVALCQSQQEQIADLTARLEALEAT